MKDEKIKFDTSNPFIWLIRRVHIMNSEDAECLLNPYDYISCDGCIYTNGYFIQIGYSKGTALSTLRYLVNGINIGATLLEFESVNVENKSIIFINENMRGKRDYHHIDIKIPDNYIQKDMFFYEFKKPFFANNIQFKGIKIGEQVIITLYPI